MTRCTSRVCSATSISATLMSPVSGVSSPAMQRMSVVLPAPLGPTSAVTLPLATVSVTLSSAR